MLKIFSAITKYRWVLKKEHLNSDKLKSIEDQSEIKCCAPGGGTHWWDYSTHDIDLLIDKCLENWDQWFMGYRKVDISILPYQIRELARDCGVMNQEKKDWREKKEKDWLTKKEAGTLKKEARRIAIRAHIVENRISYYYKN